MKVATDREKVNFIKYGLAVGLGMDKLLSLLEEGRKVQDSKQLKLIYEDKKNDKSV